MVDPKSGPHTEGMSTSHTGPRKSPAAFVALTVGACVLYFLAASSWISGCCGSSSASSDNQSALSYFLLAALCAAVALFQAVALLRNRGTAAGVTALVIAGLVALPAAGVGMVAGKTFVDDRRAVRASTTYPHYGREEASAGVDIQAQRLSDAFGLQATTSPTGVVIEPAAQIVESKSSRYAALTGSLPVESPRALAEVERTLSQHGWRNIESSPSATYRGYEVRAHRAGSAVSVHVGPGTGVMVPLEQGVYVSLRVGSQSEHLGWTQPF